MTDKIKDGKYQVQQHLERCFVWMLKSNDFVALAPVAMVGNTQIVSDEKQWPSPMRTAYTDGRNVRLWKEYAESLTEEELRFVLIHENYHKAYRHLTLYKKLCKQNAVAANIAMDYRINADIINLKNPNIAMPNGCLYDAKYDDAQHWDTPRIYKDLLANGMPPPKCNGNCQAGNGNGTPNGQCTCAQGFDEHGWGDADNLSPEEERQLAQDIDQALRQGAILAGRRGLNVDRTLGDLMKVKVDYKQALREFLSTYTRGGDESSWSRPNRRFVGNDVYMPTTLSQSMGEMVISVDTSGSVGAAELTLFLSNVCHILKTIKPLKLHLIWWDAAVAGHEQYEPAQYDSLPQLVRPKGGGGTDVRCVDAYLKEHNIRPEVGVFLSDGYLSSTPPNFGFPVLWAIIQNESFNPPAPQKVIHLPSDWADN